MRRNLVIPDDKWKNLVVFIMNKQGELKKGDLSKWVTIAINNLTTGYSTQAQSTQNANPYLIPKGRLQIKNLMQHICKRWIDSGMRDAPINPGTTIPLIHLDQMIREVTGHHDQRTVKKHIQNLMKFGYITDRGYTGAFLIVNTGTDLEEIERVQEEQRHNEKRNQLIIKKLHEAEVLENKR